MIMNEVRTHVGYLEEMRVEVVHVDEPTDVQDKGHNFPHIECGKKHKE